MPRSLRRASDASWKRAPIASLADLVNAFDTPVYVVSAGGTLVHANGTARARGAAAANWVVAFAHDIPTPNVPASAQKLTFTHGGVGMVLVFSAGEERVGEPDWSQVELNAALHAVATLLAQGMRDKAIAERLGRPVATVRSYVTRIYRTLGVKRRVDVVLLAKNLPRRA